MTSCSTFLDTFHTNDQAFDKKNQKILIFIIVFVEITQKNDLKLPENVKSGNDPLCL